VYTAADQAEVGQVKDVLVDDAGEPHFLDVNLGIFRKRVLVPVQRISTDASDERVWVAGLGKDGFEEIPAYDGDLARLNADYRAGLLDRYTAVERGHTSHDADPSGRRLARLGELDDFEVDRNDPDVRGWKVFASDNEQIGKVEDLVVDTAAMKVRYLDIELDRDHRRSDEESRVLIPIDHANLRPDDDEVRLDTIGSGQVADLPTHTGRYDGSYETTLLTAFDRSRGTTPPDTRRR
jgi:photosynthetic reaction center H subunit